MNATYITFGIYILLMVGVGILFAKKAAGSLEEYLLGGRGMGSWVTAFSAQASDMSGWLLMGLPGAVFFAGLGESWIAIGLLIGTLLNWLFVAGRLRIFTEETQALTLATFFGNRFRDTTKLIRLISALLTLFFFTVYAASGLASAGKLFETLFGFPYATAVLVGAAVMVFYTLLGGFLAVCWTDLMQGILMFCAITVLPLLVYFQLDAGAITLEAAAKGIPLKLLAHDGTSLGVALLAAFSAAAWGLGYFGQPHILTRFMSIKSIRLLPRTITIAMIWVTVSLGFAVFIGVIAIALYPSEALPNPDNEKVFIYMIEQFCHPLLCGILFAALLAAVMSTIDSQLLASSSTLVEDFYSFMLRKNPSRMEQMWVSRIAVLLIAGIAVFLALNPNQTIFGLVKFAWGGLGAVFGPVVLIALFWRRASYAGVIAGMIMGTVVLLEWYSWGLGKYLYEIVPGMAANFIGIVIFSLIFPPKPNVVDQYDKMLDCYRQAKTHKL